LARTFTKAYYRTFWKERRDELSQLSSQFSKTICEFIQQSSEFRQARQVAVFHGRPWEINLRTLWESNRGKCFYPLSLAHSLEMHFYKIGNWAELQPGYGGILEPSAEPAKKAALWQEADLVLVPGTCFDPHGGRIGSGKGFYDRFLAKNPAAFWGVCLSAQIIDSALAQEPTDVRMGALCTEKGIRRIL
jgi:5-formyltetrahydrofolate cyclo-ligase